MNTNNYKNEFEKEVANALKEAGYEVVENVKLANFNCDLKVIDKEDGDITKNITSFTTIVNFLYKKVFI